MWNKRIINEETYGMVGVDPCWDGWGREEEVVGKLDRLVINKQDMHLLLRVGGAKRERNEGRNQ